MLKLRAKFERDAHYGGMGWTEVMHMTSWGVVAMGCYWLGERLLD